MQIFCWCKVLLPKCRCWRLDILTAELIIIFQRMRLGRQAVSIRCRVVSVLDSGAEGTLSGNSLRQTVYTRCASVHQAAKLVSSLLRVAVVTAVLAESNVTSPAGWLPKTGISSGTLRSIIEYGLPFYSPGARSCFNSLSYTMAANCIPGRSLLSPSALFQPRET